VEDELPGIQQSPAADGASLHLAHRGETAVGFALLVTHRHVLEVLHLGVDPDVWSSGVGSSLLVYAQDLARATGHDSLELWVIDHDERAVQVHERSGWSGTDDVEVRNASGRLERRFVRHAHEDLVARRTRCGHSTPG